MNRPLLKIGDVVFFGGRRSGWFGKAIRWCTRAANEPPTKMYHVGQICAIDEEGEPLLGEALATVRIHPAWPEIDKGEVVEIWRLIDRDELQRRAIMRYWQGVHGMPYGAWKLVPHALDGLLGKVFGGSPCLFRRVFFLKELHVCSGHVGQAEWTATGDPFPFGLPVGTESPDDQHDWVKLAGSGWYLLWSSEDDTG